MLNKLLRLFHALFRPQEKLVQRLRLRIDELEREVCRRSVEFRQQQAHSARLADKISRLRRETLIDPLTGILNRRGLDRGATKIFSMLEQEATIIHRTLQAAGHRNVSLSIAILFVDVDDFKGVNERLGHLEADKRLVRIGEIMRAVFRRQDDLIERVCGRFGGDEFIAFLLHPTREGALKKAEEFRSAVADAKLGCTVSIGLDWIKIEDIIRCRQEGEGLELLIETRKERANRLMQEAKRAGKNQIVSLRPELLH
jgi:diguanylate cyclase (GGDEF)-like protein